MCPFLVCCSFFFFWIFCCAFNMHVSLMDGWQKPKQTKSPRRSTRASQWMLRTWMFDQTAQFQQFLIVICSPIHLACLFSTAVTVILWWIYLICVCVVYGVWCMVYGMCMVWCVVHDHYFFIRCSFPLIFGCCSWIQNPSLHLSVCLHPFASAFDEDASVMIVLSN